MEHDYIQGCYRNRKTEKIYIDIEKEHLKEATEYFQKHFSYFWQKNLLELVEQEPIVYYSEQPSGNRLTTKKTTKKGKQSTNHEQVK